jgi:hypothetical protein
LGAARYDAIVFSLGLAVGKCAAIDGSPRFISRAAQVSAAVRSRARRATASCQVSSLVLPEELLTSSASPRGSFAAYFIRDFSDWKNYDKVDGF